jgi:hypothetical protein
MIAGEYRSDPLENAWLKGVIELGKKPGESWRWRNEAGVSWRLDPDLKNGILNTATDNPYYRRKPDNGRMFRIVLRRGPDGEYMPEVAGFQFLGAFYRKVQ